CPYTTLFRSRKEKENGSEINYEIDDHSTKVGELKTAVVNQLSPYKYDQTKVTYFTYKPFEQLKQVEIFFFQKTEYKMVFNTGAVEKPISIRIYDKPSDYASRTLLAEQENASGGMFEFTSTELLENLKERKILDDGMSKMEADDLELKKVYINYYIPSKPKETKEGEKGE